MFGKLVGKKGRPKVSLTGSGISFDVGRNETVLEAALKAGIAYPHD